MQKVPDARCGGEVTVYECLQGFESVLVGTDRPTFLLTAPLFFTFLTSNFPTLFVLLNFIL